MRLNAEVLEVLLPTLANAPAAWQAEAVVGCDQPSGELRDLLATMTTPLLSPFAISAQLEAELVAALRGAAARGATAKLASKLACANRASRDVVDALASAAERAARIAQARAVHDMVRALRECDLPEAVKETVVKGLAAWARCCEASTALDGRYNDDASPTAKWRAFARAFAIEATDPRCMDRTGWLAQQARRVAVMLMYRLSGQPTPSQSELEAQEKANWCNKMCKLVRGAPAATTERRS